MSKENARLFVQAVLNDEELRGNTANMKPEEVIAFAKEMGYDFTLDELKEVKKEDIELSLDELEAVAGGRDKVFDAMDNTKKFWKKLPEQLKHCHGAIKGPLHNWVKVGHKEEPILCGLLSWVGDWTNGYDVYECSLCKEIQNRSV